MGSDGQRAAWQRVLDDLSRWHTRRDATSARHALSFLEPELRLAIPPIVRRKWPKEQVEDVLRELLTMLLERPLPAGISDPRGYLLQTFRNRCVDLHRAQQRHERAQFKDKAGWDLPAAPPHADARLEREDSRATIQAALLKLSVSDRVALKLCDAPEWLDEVEIRWLANKVGVTPDVVLTMLDVATDVFTLTEIFDPPPQGAPDDRRQRMERFRKRRARAREKLRVVLEAQGVKS